MDGTTRTDGQRRQREHTSLQQNEDNVARQRTCHIVETVTTQVVVTVHMNAGESPHGPLRHVAVTWQDTGDNHDDRPLPVNDHPPPSTAHNWRRPPTNKRASRSPTNHDARESLRLTDDSQRPSTDTRDDEDAGDDEDMSDDEDTGIDELR